MTDNQPSVVMVKDDEGRTHWTSPNSELAKKYAEKGVPDATEPEPESEDRDAGTTDSGSSDGERTSRTSRRAARSAGEAQPESGGEHQPAG